MKRAGLTGSGALAALLVGAAALAVSWRWAAVLVLFFAAAMAVSRFRSDDKLRAAGDLLGKTGARDAVQVAANGGAFAVGALAYAVTGQPPWAAFALGALAAASADTWATEIGLLSPHEPRSVTNGRRVPPGFSGGVTLAGTLAGGAGALLVAGAAVVLHAAPSAAAIIAGGVAGMFIDSLLGATVQEHRWCGVCARATERRVHACGTPTTRASGLPGVGNDVVNALATVLGGLCAALVWQVVA